MKSPLHAIAACGLAMIAATAAFLLHMKRSHRLGEPGVRLVAAPTLSETGEVARTNSVYLPPAVPGWTSTNQPITALELSYLPHDTTYGRRTYVSETAGRSIHTSVVLMGTDRTSIHKPEYCLTGQGFNIERRGHARVQVGKPRPYDLMVRRFDASINVKVEGQTRLLKAVFLFWFVTDGLLTADHTQRMWWMARDQIGRAHV